MSQIGIIVNAQEIPPATTQNTSTGNAFFVGLADWGPVGASVVTTPYASLAGVAAAIGPPNGGVVQGARTATNSTLYDSADAFFREGGSNLYISRVVGPAPTFGSVGLQNASAGQTAINVTAAYVGVGSSSLNIAVNSTGSVYTAVLTDANGNVLNTSPTLSNAASAHTDFVTWAATTNLITAVGSVAGSPKAITATPLSAGTDDRGNASVSNWTSALGGFGSNLGPGQVAAPAQTNTGLAGIWSALCTHASTNNRIALLDGTDANTATAAITEVATASLSTGAKNYSGIWVGNLLIPGVTSGTTRNIAPSPVVAALCARSDSRGNANIAAAGTSYPLQYVNSVNTSYTGPLTGDIANLNGAGINVFSTQFGILQNFGFVSALGTPANDAIYWQLNHCRLRMAITNSANFVAQPFLFSQIDGQGQTLASFGGAMAGMLLNFFNVGALYGASANEAFTVNVGPSINTPASLSSGNLQASLAVRMSPFAQLVEIVINAVPITQSLTQAAA